MDHAPEPGGEGTQCVCSTNMAGQSGEEHAGRGGSCHQVSHSLGKQADQLGFVLRAGQAMRLSNLIRFAFLKDS